MELPVAQPPLTNPQEPSVIKPMPKTPYIIGALIVTIASAILVAWVFFGFGETFKNFQSPPPSQIVSQESKTKGFPRVPVKIVNSAIKAVEVFYTFEGTILEIKKVPEGLQFVTDVKIAKLPKFIVDSETNIKLGLNEKKDVSQSELKVGQKVQIRISYGLKKKEWNNVATVVILQ